MKDIEILIDPTEAVTLAGYTTSECLSYIGEIIDAVNERMAGETDERWKYYCTLNAIFTVGRIQGIREERKRKQARA